MGVRALSMPATEEGIRVWAVVKKYAGSMLPNPPTMSSQGKFWRVRWARWVQANGAMAKPAMAMRPRATSKAGKRRPPAVSNNAIFMRMKELPHTNPSANSASHILELEVPMRLQN